MSPERIKKLLPAHKEACKRPQKAPGTFCKLDEGHRGHCKPESLLELPRALLGHWERRLK